MVGIPKMRHVVRTTASAAIFEMLYVGIITRWLSPSGSVSSWGEPSAASYTPVDEQCRNAFAPRQWAMSKPAASALPARSVSHLLLFTTAKLHT